MVEKPNHIFWILGVIGTANIIAAIILLISIRNPLVSMMLFVSGILLIIGGAVDRKHRKNLLKKRRGHK